MNLATLFSQRSPQERYRHYGQRKERNAQDYGNQNIFVAPGHYKNPSDHHSASSCHQRQ